LENQGSAAIGYESPAIRFIPMKNRDVRSCQVYLTWGNLTILKIQSILTVGKKPLFLKTTMPLKPDSSGSARFFIGPIVNGGTGAT
jgi:hypothetical protein